MLHRDTTAKTLKNMPPSLGPTAPNRIPAMARRKMTGTGTHVTGMEKKILDFEICRNLSDIVGAVEVGVAVPN